MDFYLELQYLISVSWIAIHFLVRPEVIACGADLSFTRDVFFLPREISEMRGPTGVKFCMMVSTGPYFIMPVQNFGGHPPKKLSGAKNVQNLARFRATSKFGNECLRSCLLYTSDAADE